MLAAFYGGAAVGFIFGALVILAIVTRPQRVPPVRVVTPPLPSAIPAQSRRRSWPWR